MSLGSGLKQLRERAGYSREYAARRAFRSSDPDHVRRLEEFEADGARPTLKVLRSLLAAYDVNPVGQEEQLRSYRVAMRLKRRAGEKGLTLKHVADKVGVDRTNLSKFFNGSRLVKKAPVLLGIASVLEMDEEEKRELLREAGFEHLHLVLGGQYDGAHAAHLLQELRGGVGTDRHPRTENLARPSGETEVTEVQGAPNIVAAASEMVLSNLPDSRSSEASIRISVADLSMVLDETVQDLARALRIAVERGVSLQLLLPLGDEPEKIVKTIVGCLQYLGQEGGFEVRWLDPARTVPPLSMMILPDASVFLFLPHSKPGRPERAVLIRRMRSFVDHFDSRFEGATPLLKLYDSTRSGVDELVEGLTAAEKDSEAVLVVKRSLTPHTIPEDLWELEERQLRDHGGGEGELVRPNDPQRYELFSIGPVPPEERDGILQRLRTRNRQRLEGHLGNLERGTVREVYLKEYLEKLLRYPSEVYPAAARVAIIDHLLDWLKRYPRYQIGLATEGDPIASPLFGVHNSSRVFLSVWRPGGGAQYLEVCQPVVARIFEQYFLQLWSDLPSTERTDGAGESEKSGKDGVTAWLEGLRKEITESEAGRG